MTNGFIQYRITSQTKMEDLTPDGRFVEVWEIRFETPSGTQGFVKVPGNIYEPAVVDRVVQDEVQRIETVNQLGNAPVEGNDF